MKMKMNWLLVLAVAMTLLAPYSVTSTADARGRSGLTVTVYRYRDLDGGQWLTEAPWIRNRGRVCTVTNFSRIDHDWADSAVSRRCPKDDFVVHYQGSLKVPASGVYTFYSSTDDGFRLEIGPSIVISDWELQSMSDWNSSGAIELNANRRYQLEAWLFENSGGAGAELHYSIGGGEIFTVPDDWYVNY